jgi:uncharacterized protein DUF4160
MVYFLEGDQICRSLQGFMASSSRCISAKVSAVFNIETLDMMEGDLPARAHKLVREWAVQYQSELLRMWQTNEFRQLPGLE